MPQSPRKRSPSAPSMPLDEAISRAIAVYEKEQRHAAPTDVVAQDLGYKSANSGSAMTAIASLRGYGLLERPEPGKLAVSADVQSFQYAPDEELKNQLVINWLKSPPVFASLLEKYADNLPSDKTIRYDLIQSGFKPGAVESILKTFRRSVEFAKYYEVEHAVEPVNSQSELASVEEEEHVLPNSISKPPEQLSPVNVSLDSDSIPVRLDSSRRAWLVIPTPLYVADKVRLKAQIDLLLTDDDEDKAT